MLEKCMKFSALMHLVICTIEQFHNADRGMLNDLKEKLWPFEATIHTGIFSGATNYMKYFYARTGRISM